jgi:hypothetical protein
MTAVESREGPNHAINNELERGEIVAPNSPGSNSGLRRSQFPGQCYRCNKIATFQSG